MIPAIKEAITIVILAALTISGKLKANKVINTDMVKPIPPKNPAPISKFQSTPRGITAHFILIVSQLKSKMPRGFPRHKPVKIPTINEFGLPSKR